MLAFYERIDNLLKEKKYTQKDLSEYLKISSAQVFANWKQRDFIPSADIAVKIAQYLGTSVEYLITGKETDERLEELRKEKDIYKEKYDNLRNTLKETLEGE